MARHLQSLQRYIRKGLQRKCFSINLAKFFSAAFTKNTSGRALLFGPNRGYSAKVLCKSAVLNYFVK